MNGLVSDYYNLTGQKDINVDNITLTGKFQRSPASYYIGIRSNIQNQIDGISTGNTIINNYSTISSQIYYNSIVTNNFNNQNTINNNIFNSISGSVTNIYSTINAITNLNQYFSYYISSLSGQIFNINNNYNNNNDINYNFYNSLSGKIQSINYNYNNINNTLLNNFTQQNTINNNIYATISGSNLIINNTINAISNINQNFTYFLSSLSGQFQSINNNYNSYNAINNNYFNSLSGQIQSINYNYNNINNNFNSTTTSTYNFLNSLSGLISIKGFGSAGRDGVDGKNGKDANNGIATGALVTSIIDGVAIIGLGAATAFVLDLHQKQIVLILGLIAQLEKYTEVLDTRIYQHGLYIKELQQEMEKLKEKTRFLDGNSFGGDFKLGGSFIMGNPFCYASFTGEVQMQSSLTITKYLFVSGTSKLGNIIVVGDEEITGSLRVNGYITSLDNATITFGPPVVQV